MVASNSSGDTAQGSYSPSGMNVGIVIDGNGKLLFGENFALVGDIRYYAEGATKAKYTNAAGETKEKELFKRANLSLGIGAEIRF